MTEALRKITRMKDHGYKNGPKSFPGVIPALVPSNLSQALPFKGTYQWEHIVPESPEKSTFELEVFIFLGIHEDAMVGSGEAHGRTGLKSKHNWFPIIVAGPWASISKNRCLYPRWLSNGKKKIDFNTLLTTKDFTFVNGLYESHKFPHLPEGATPSNQQWLETIIIKPSTDSKKQTAWGPCEFSSYASRK
jgi:hypothetical protein